MDKDKFFEKLGITPGGWEIERFNGQKPYLIGTNKSVVCVFGSHNRIKNQFVEGDTKMLAASKQMFLALYELINDRCSDIGTLKSGKCECPIADDIDEECYFHKKIRALENATGKKWEEIKAIAEECEE